MSGAFPKKKLLDLFRAADLSPSGPPRGLIMERAMKLLFETIPGVTAIESDVKNAANTEEVDIVFWNQCIPRGLYFLGIPFLMECKNWQSKVSGQEVVVFANTMRGRCCRDGILVAAQGITGRPGELREAHYEIAEAARAGQRARHKNDLNAR
jgi:hypothetical protein